jgi:hypothetical protein
MELKAEKRLGRKSDAWETLIFLPLHISASFGPLVRLY